MLRDAAVRKNIRNLAYSIHAAAGSHHFVEQRSLRRRHSVVMTVRRARKVCGAGAHKRTRNNTRDIIRTHQLIRYLAQLIKALKAKGLLMRRNLQHAVSRGIDNRLAAPHMLLAQLLDNLRAAGMTFAQHARQLALFDERSHQLLRKAVRHIWEIAPVEGDRHAADFPVTAQRVLALADLLRIGISANSMCCAQGNSKLLAAAQHRSCLQSALRQMRQLQRTNLATIAARIFRQPLADMAQSICALIAIGSSIMCITNAKGIQ